MLPHSNKFIFSLLLVTIFDLVHRAAAENYKFDETPAGLIGPEKPLKLHDLMTKPWDTVKFTKQGASTEDKPQTSSTDDKPQTLSLFDVVQEMKFIPISADSLLEIHLLEKLKKMHDQSERTRTISLLVLLLTVFFIVILVVIVGLFVHLLKS